MPWSGSSPNQSATRTDGTRTGSDTWAQASAASVKILSTSHDTHDQDVADMIDDCLKKDGGNTATADLPMGGFSLTGLGSAAARTESAAYSDLQDNKGEYVATVGGTADVITITPTIAITAYAAGQRFSFLASGTNTGATTLNVSAVAAKAVVRNDGSNTALSAGDITSGQMVDVEYDGTRFKMLNWIGSSVPLTALNINGGTAETSPAVADLVPIYDASATANRKMTLANLWKTITALTAETSPATDDELSLYDTSASATDKITLANVLKVVNSLTEDTSPDSSNDFVLTYDASASAAKKVKPSNLLPAATQAEQETGSSLTVAVTPGRQHFHASACKAWAKFSSPGTLAASDNVSSVTDNAAGDWTVTIGTDFSSANYAGLATCGSTSACCAVSPVFIACRSQAAGTFRLLNSTTAGSAVDPNSPDAVYFASFGDHA